MSEYKHVIYSTGFAIKVMPEDRAVDVMHYLTTGGLLGGRSLDGVEIEEITDEHYNKVCERSAKVLARSMRQAKESGRINMESTPSGMGDSFQQKPNGIKPLISAIRGG